MKKDGAAAIVHQEKKNSILSQIHRIIGPFILRRKKSDVAHDILPKKEVLVYCPFTLQQRQQYQAFMNTIKRQKANSDSQSNYFNMQYMMVIDLTEKCMLRFTNPFINDFVQDLRSACNHPYIKMKPDENLVTQQDYIDVSGKMQVLHQMFERLRKDGHKTLVFSQFTRVLDMIGITLQHKG